MNYEPVDRLPVLALEPYESGVIDRWRREGLPRGIAPAEHLGMAELTTVPITWGPIPGFDLAIIEDQGDYYVQKNFMGALTRCRKDAPTTFYGHIDHPVKTRADWDLYKERFRANTPGRLPSDWDEESVRRLNAAANPVGLFFFPFFFRLGFYSMGMERFLTAFHEEPDLIHDMFSFWGEFVLAATRPLLANLAIDVAVFNEDLAGKNAALISPAMYGEFWYPYQDPIIELLRQYDVPVICQWSAGQFESMLPSMMAHGFNCTWPLEKTAGMDAAQLRSRFGRDLRLGGNIAKEALIAGPAAIDAEVERLMPLIRAGGFLPALDDMVPLECPFSHYRHLIERLKAITF